MAQNWMRDLDFEKKTLLILEKDSQLSEEISKALEQRDFQCLQIQESQEALEILESHTPTAILVDSEFQEEEGIVFHSICEKARTHHVPLDLFEKDQALLTLPRLVLSLEEKGSPSALPEISTRAKENEISLGQERTVLIVDQDLQGLLQLTEQMESWGFQVLVARSGRHALEQLQDNAKIDLILMNSNLKKDGLLETLQKIHSYPDFAGLPVIVIGDFPERFAPEWSMVNAFLHTPLQRESLTEALRAVDLIH